MDDFDRLWPDLKLKAIPDAGLDPEWYCLLGVLARAIATKTDRPRHTMMARLSVMVKEGKVTPRPVRGLRNVYVLRTAAKNLWDQFVPAPEPPPPAPPAPPPVPQPPPKPEPVTYLLFWERLTAFVQEKKDWSGTVRELVTALGVPNAPTQRMRQFLTRQRRGLTAKGIRWEFLNNKTGPQGLYRLWVEEPPAPPTPPVPPDPANKIGMLLEDIRASEPEEPQSAQFALETQRARLGAARDFREYNRRPSTRYRAAIRKDGDDWVAYIPGWTHPTVLGRGATPDDAMRDFDRAFMGVKA